MKTARIKITSLAQLQQNIAVLKKQCAQHEEELTQEWQFLNNNKLKILWYATENGNNKSFQAVMKLIEKVIIAYLLQGKSGVIGSYIVKSAGGAIKEYAGGKWKKLFKKKKTEAVNVVEPTSE